MVKLLKTAGVKLPDWVQQASTKTKIVRHADKLRKNQPKEETPAVEEVAAEEVSDTETTE